MRNYGAKVRGGRIGQISILGRRQIGSLGLEIGNWRKGNWNLGLEFGLEFGNGIWDKILQLKFSTGIGD